MEYDLVSKIGNCIDNVYNNTCEDGSRRTVAKLLGDNAMTIEFRTIMNIAREEDLHFQMQAIKKETNEMISSRLKSIKAEFKSSSGRALITKKTGEVDSIETLTVSPYSPHRKMKYCCKYTYEVK